MMQDKDPTKKYLLSFANNSLHSPTINPTDNLLIRQMHLKTKKKN